MTSLPVSLTGVTTRQEAPAGAGSSTHLARSGPGRTVDFIQGAVVR